MGRIHSNLNLQKKACVLLGCFHFSIFNKGLEADTMLSFYFLLLFPPLLSLVLSLSLVKKKKKKKVECKKMPKKYEG